MSTPKVYTIYMSNVSGNVIAIKNTQRLTLLLDGNKIAYTLVDISLDENKDHKESMKAKSKSKKPTMTPQIFYNGEYVADFDEADEWNECEILREKLA